MAADVRDAAPKTVSLTPVEDGCGLAGSNIAGIFATPGPIRVGQGASFTHHGVCTFELPALLEDRTIVSATLTLQQSMVEVEFEAGGHVIAQSVVFPVPMPDDVTDQTTVILSDLGTLADGPELGPQTSTFSPHWWGTSRPAAPSPNTGSISCLPLSRGPSDSPG